MRGSNGKLCFSEKGLRVCFECDEVYGKKRGWNSKGDTWWWNDEVKEELSRKKEVHKAMCQNSTEKNNRRSKSMMNKAKKAVSEEMREKADDEIPDLQNCPNRMFWQVKGLMTDSKEVVGGRCMKGSVGKLCLGEKERGKVLKDYMERTISEKK